MSGRTASPGQTLTTSQHSLSFSTTIDGCWWPCCAARTDQWSMLSFVAHSLVLFTVFTKSTAHELKRLSVSSLPISSSDTPWICSLPDSRLFYIQDVAVSILQRKPFILSQSESFISHFPTQSLPLEPYHLLSPSSVCELFNTSKADQPASSSHPPL